VRNSERRRVDCYIDFVSIYGTGDISIFQPTSPGMYGFLRLPHGDGDALPAQASLGSFSSSTEIGDWSSSTYIFC